MPDRHYSSLMTSLAMRLGGIDKVEQTVLRSLQPENHHLNGVDGWPSTQTFIGFARHLADKMSTDRAALFEQAASTAEEALSQARGPGAALG